VLDPGGRGGRWVLFALGWVSAAYFTPRDPGWNVNTRLDLTYAMVDEHRLTIDSFHEARGYATGDKAVFNGHYYSDKVPGNSFAGVIPYQVARWLGVPMSPTAKRMVCTIFTVGVAFGALLVLLARLMERQGVSPRHATGLALLGGLGTMLFPYATLFMPYVPGCLLSLLAYRLVLPDSPDDLPQSVPLRRIALSGFCVGLAMMFDFLFGLIGLALLLHVVLTRRSGPGGTAARIAPPALFVLAWIVGLAGHFVYSMAVFGSLATPYAHEVDPFFREAMASGLSGIHFPPRLSILWLINFHPFRGLFVYSPLLLIALPGLVAMLRLPHGLPRAFLCGGLFLGYLLANGGYYHQWWGGWACGPRLLIPAIPFLLLAVAAAWARWRWLRPAILAAGVLSITLQLLAAGVDPQPPTPVPGGDANAYLAQARLGQWYPIPLTTIWLPRLRDGLVAWNPGLAFALRGVWSWLPLVGMWIAAGLWCGLSRNPARRPQDSPPPVD
jgi:hypothetical protein